MRRLSTLLLLCAVGLSVCVNAHPYSKIPDSIHLGNGFTSKKSSSSSSSNSYAQANQDKIEIDGFYNGQGFSGSKTSGFESNGGSHSQSSSYSSSSVSGAVPIGLVSSSASSSAYAGAGGAIGNGASQVGYGALQNSGTGFLGLESHSANAGGASYGHKNTQSSGQETHSQGAAATAATSGQAGHGSQAGQAAGAQYWWNGEQNPFAAYGDGPSVACTSSGCAVGGSLHLINVGNAGAAQAANQGSLLSVKIHGNPFLAQGHQQTVGGSSAGASGGSSYAFGSSSGSGSSASGHTGSRMDVSKNPFLNGVGVTTGSFGGHGSVDHHGSSSHHGSADHHGSSSHHGSADHHGSSSHHGSVDHHGSSSHHGSGSTSGHAADTQSNFAGTGNPFLSTVPTGFTHQVPQIPSSSSGSGSSAVFGQQVPQRPSISGSVGSGNPFLSGPQVPQIPQIPQVPQVTQLPQFPQIPQLPQIPQIPQIPEIPQLSQGQEDAFGGQQVGGFPTFTAGNNDQKITYEPQGELGVSCNGQGRICVPKNLCSADGYVISNDIHQVQSAAQVCQISNQVCCTLRSSAGDQSQAGSFGGHSTISTSFGTGYDQSESKEGGIFGNANGNHEQTDFNTSEGGNGAHQGLFGNSNDDSNGYLPPLGSEPSSNVPAFSKPPTGQEDEPTVGVPTNERPNAIFPPSASPPPQLGCAAALICVEDQFCTLQGVISPTPVVLSSEQLIRRVPLSSCKNPDNGVIGKCCRDPNYVDPWPAGNLPANYSGGFDEQGFPTFLNIAKTRPPKKQQPIGGGATKGGRPIKPSVPTYKPQINQVPNQPTQRPFPSLPNQIPSIPQHTGNTFGGGATKGGRPIETSVPTYQAQINHVPNQPTQRPFPSLPNQIPSIPQHTPNTFGGGATKGGRPIETSVPTYKPQINQVPNQPSLRPFPSLPNQISSIPQHPDNTFGGGFQRPTAAPAITPGSVPSTKGTFPPFPSFTHTTPRPSAVPNNFPNFPNVPKSPTPFPNFQNPFIKNNYDVSSSNQNPTVIAPHVPGSHCGLRNKVHRPNGLTDVDVAFGEIPWQAMILSNRDRKLLCSGAIVAPNAIVTAARCVEGLNANEVSIKTGEWKLGYELKHEEPLPYEIIKVAAIAPYPEYSTGNPGNDVAILFLEHDMTLDQHVDMLCLPQGQPQPPQPGTKCISTGWGKTVLQVNVAGSLMHSVDVDVLSNDQCQQRISGAESQIDLDDSLVCTKAHRQNNNMCQVDLGGPLACDRGDGYYELAGVYNQDTGCLPTNQVATFATIPTGWVHKMMANPPKIHVDQSQSPTSGATKQTTHNHGPKEPCDCQKSNLPSDNNQYLPPQ